ncbi:uncharacterized protein LOC108949307 [Ciona intestinalis]
MDVFNTTNTGNFTSNVTTTVEPNSKISGDSHWEYGFLVIIVFLFVCNRRNNRTRRATTSSQTVVTTVANQIRPTTNGTSPVEADSPPTADTSASANPPDYDTLVMTNENSPSSGVHRNTTLPGATLPTDAHENESEQAPPSYQAATQSSFS